MYSDDCQYHTPQQNGIAERKNRTLIETARCMMLQANLPPHFWAEAVQTANYIRNRCPSKILGGETAFKYWTGKRPSISHFKIFGSLVLSLDKNPSKGKFDTRSKNCYFFRIFITIESIPAVVNRRQEDNQE